MTMFRFNKSQDVVLGTTLEEASTAQNLENLMDLEPGETFSITEAMRELEPLVGFRASKVFNRLLRSNLIIEVDRQRSTL